MTLAAPITNSNVKYILSVVEPIFKNKNARKYVYKSRAKDFEVRLSCDIIFSSS